MLILVIKRLQKACIILLKCTILKEYKGYYPKERAEYMNTKKRTALFFLLIISITSLSACDVDTGEGAWDRFIYYLRSEWAWWDILLAILLILLVLFTILLIDAIFRKGPRKKYLYYDENSAENKLEDAVNKVTEKMVLESQLQMDNFYKDIRIPLLVTKNYAINDIDAYLMLKNDIIKKQATGKKPTSYKIGGKSFALLNDLGNGQYKLTIKCGPAYGTKLMEYFKDTISPSLFPYGFLWFSIANEKKSLSFELIKLLIDISYAIAKIGY